MARRLSSLLVVALAGCGVSGEISGPLVAPARSPAPSVSPTPSPSPSVSPTPSPSPTVSPSPSPVSRPTSISSAALPVATFALPAALAAGAPVSVASDGIFTLVGGRGGLYTLTSSTFTRVSTDAVSGMSAIPGVGIAVVIGGGLSLFDGQLEESPISEAVGQTISSIATRNTEIWIGGTSGLWIHADGHLRRFTGMGAIESVETASAASTVVALGPGGARYALRASGSRWTTTDLADEAQVDRVFAGPGGRLFGLHGDRLLERVVTATDTVAWREFAIDSGAADTIDAEATAIDPASGALWIARASGLARLDTAAGHVTTVARPSPFGRIVSASATLDGALWVSDGVGLARVGTAGPPPTFGRIARFGADNCARCHSSVARVARPILDGYEDWATNIGKIVQVLTEGRMPSDRRPLVGGTVQLIIDWRDGGLRR